jgi:hypothetical protein
MLLRISMLRSMSMFIILLPMIAKPIQAQNPDPGQAAVAPNNDKPALTRTQNLNPGKAGLAPNNEKSVPIRAQNPNPGQAAAVPNNEKPAPIQTQSPNPGQAAVVPNNEKPALKDAASGQLEAQPVQNGSYYGFANGACCMNQEANLNKNCGPFTRVTVPFTSEIYPVDFNSLCRNLGKTCLKVCDWEGHTKDCGEISQSQGGHPVRDGSRVAYCSAQ